MEAKQIYQKYLREEFERRTERNGSYSLRAYARDLEVPSPKLSQYLNGSCGISAKKALELSAKLHLGKVETELFTCSAEAAHSRAPYTRRRAKERLSVLLEETFSEINLEKFNLIRDWYHLAILEMTELEQFEMSSAWLSKALRVPVAQIDAAIGRLQRLGLLKCTSRKWTQTEKDLETPPDFASRAVRDYHHQMIQLVDKRFDEVAIEKRELGSALFSVDRALVPELKKSIRKFQKEIARLANQSQSKNVLYALNIQLMPIFEGDIQ